jgi:hypothetical protein
MVDGARIAAWLAATERITGGPLASSREHVRSEIMARFRLRITSTAISFF